MKVAVMIYAMIVWTSLLSGDGGHGVCVRWVNTHDVVRYVESLNRQYPDLIHTYSVCKET